ncbi:AfsR/SARP family transcriptional regulator, partial [Streptomyces sp. JJ38]|uniref:AfsR/SARP family transcriptional regulator n=1 Tax=Streptomyces sp. JJ38 TaxID=2738128 RepID=UPI001C5745F6
MQFGILGQVEARCGGVRIGLRPGRERSLLALLVLNSGYLLTADRVVTLLWEKPPDSARAQVYNLVSGLRRRLHSAAFDRDGAGDVLVTADGGYRLEPARHRTDLGAFRTAAARGREAMEQGAGHRAATLLSQALDCWRGEALSGCAAPFAAAVRQTLEDERRRAVEALLDVHLALGRHERVLAEVGPWLEQQPYREDLYRRQMLALAAQGRRADALACYRHAYRRLGEDLGVEPGPPLRELHEQILRGAVPPVPPLAAEATAGRRRPPRANRSATGHPDGEPEHGGRDDDAPPQAAADRPDSAAGHGTTRRTGGTPDTAPDPGTDTAPGTDAAPGPGTDAAPDTAPTPDTAPAPDTAPTLG